MWRQKSSTSHGSQMLLRIHIPVRHQVEPMPFAALQQALVQLVEGFSIRIDARYEERSRSWFGVTRRHKRGRSLHDIDAGEGDAVRTAGMS